MKMREENLRQRKAHPVAHHLALGALTTFEEESLAFAHESHSGDVALDSWSRGGGAEKGDGKHGGEYRAAMGGTGRQKAARGSCRPMPPSAAFCRLLPPVAALKNLYRQIPPGPFLEIREELAYGLERRIQIFVQQRIRRDLARVQSLVHVRNQLLRALRRPLRHVGELLLGDALNVRSRREQTVAQAGVVVHVLGAQEIGRRDNSARVLVGPHLGIEVQRHRHVSHALQPHVPHPPLLHPRDAHRVAFLQAAHVLEHDIHRDRLRDDRAAGEPEHEAREHDEAHQHQGPDGDFPLIRYVHAPPDLPEIRIGSASSRDRVPGTAAPPDPWTRGSRPAVRRRGSSPATGAPPGPPPETSPARRATPPRSSPPARPAAARPARRSRPRSPDRAPTSARPTGDTWAARRSPARSPRASSSRPTAPPAAWPPRPERGSRAAGIPVSGSRKISRRYSTSRR